MSKGCRHVYVPICGVFCIIKKSERERGKRNLKKKLHTINLWTNFEFTLSILFISRKKKNSTNYKTLIFNFIDCRIIIYIFSFVYNIFQKLHSDRREGQLQVAFLDFREDGTFVASQNSFSLIFRNSPYISNARMSTTVCILLRGVRGPPLTSLLIPLFSSGPRVLWLVPARFDYHS